MPVVVVALVNREAAMRPRLGKTGRPRLSTECQQAAAKAQLHQGAAEKVSNSLKLWQTVVDAGWSMQQLPGAQEIPQMRKRVTCVEQTWC